MCLCASHMPYQYQKICGPKQIYTDTHTCRCKRSCSRQQGSVDRVAQVCMYMYMYTRMHHCMYTKLNAIYMHGWVLCTYVFVNICIMCVHMHVHGFVSHASLHAYTYTCICMARSKKMHILGNGMCVYMHKN